jgi:sterol desaturase/sphingolipid hydroxylase (fatty acid hydroxylase superfamily)
MNQGRSQMVATSVAAIPRAAVRRRRRERRRTLLVVVLVLVVALPTLVAALVTHDIVALLGDTGAVRGAAVSAWDSWCGAVIAPWYLGLLVVLFALQLRFPARASERRGWVGLAQDAVWFLLATALAVTVLALYLSAIGSAYDRWIVHSLDLQPMLGASGLAALAFVLVDLLAWWTHWLHHKVPLLWEFHAVHHSQQTLNVLSDHREHVVETAISATLVFVPARILGLDTAAATTLAFVAAFVGAIVHANIRTNFGPLRYVFVSPQAHRVHHSPEPEHIDTNFATVLACWDYLFGTRYRGDDEYPATGIHDEQFPIEQSAHPIALVGHWVRQLAYPFRRLTVAGRLGRSRGGLCISRPRTAQEVLPSSSADGN